MRVGILTALPPTVAPVSGGAGEAAVGHAVDGDVVRVTLPPSPGSPVAWRAEAAS